MQFVTKLAGLAVLCAMFALPASALAQNVGVVNVQRVFKEIKETKDLEARFNSLGTQLQQQKQAAESQVQALQDQRKLFKPGSAEYENAGKEITRTAAEAQVRLQFAQQDLLQEQKRQTRAVFDKVAAAVKTLAEERKLTAVLSQVNPEATEDQYDRLTPEQLNQLLSSRNMLYVSPEVDLTSEVISRMDAGYTPSGGGGGGGGGAAPAPAPGR